MGSGSHSERVIDLEKHRRRFGGMMGRGYLSQSDVRFEYPQDTGIALGNFDDNETPDVFIRVLQEDQVCYNHGKGGFIYGKFKMQYDGFVY